MSHVEFAYNRSVHSTTYYSPFEVGYGFNPLTPLGMLPFPSNEYDNFDGKKKADRFLSKSCMHKFEPTLRRRMNNMKSK